MAQDFNADASNNPGDTRKFPKSGASAGVESGLSSVDNMPRGNVESQQKTHGSVFRQESTDESAGSKGGKNFSFRY